MESKSSDSISVRYHDIFDYKLTKDDAIKWQYKNQKVTVKGNKTKTRLEREAYSKKKLIIAKRACKLISKVPTVLFVGITGSLAMMNADKNSDIDLLIITRKNTLWTSRLLCYVVIWLYGYKTRRPEQSDEKDKLCLNMWLDETSLVWDRKDRNIYTAHEIAQVVPLVNKESVYENLLYLNKWILNYWPKAVRIKRIEKREKRLVKKLHTIRYTLYAIEFIARQIQLLYMKNKITTEIVTHNKAVFHKNNWGKKILTRLKAID